MLNWESIININHIIDNLFASSREIADNDKILNNNKINVIISLNNQTPLNNLDYDVSYFKFGIEDNPNFDIITYCIQIYNIITENNKENQNILIHCDAGVSRTGAILVFYLMKKYNYGYDKSLEYIKTKRPCIELNQGFEFNLRLLELNNHKLRTIKVSRTPSIYFVYYNNLVNFLNDNSYDDCNIIIGLGNGMNYGNYTYHIFDSIDELLQIYQNIKTHIKSQSKPLINDYNCIIYGTKYLIDMFKNLYYNTKYKMTNEEIDKVDNFHNNDIQKLNSSYTFNLFENDKTSLIKLNKTELVILLDKLDKYMSKNDEEKIYKKEMISEIEKLL